MVLIENATAEPVSYNLRVDAFLELVLPPQVDDDADMEAFSRKAAELFEHRGVEESMRKLFAADEGMLGAGALQCRKQATEVVD
jgi:hypothetical protein